MSQFLDKYSRNDVIGPAGFAAGHDTEFDDFDDRTNILTNITFFQKHTLEMFLVYLYFRDIKNAHL